jgi:hypothetical protein
MVSEPSSDTHLEVEEIVGYTAGTLSSSARERVERHLADCTECTSEIVAVSRLHQPVRTRTRRLAIAAAAAAAVIGGIAVLGPGVLHRAPAEAPIRGESQPAVVVILPANSALLHQAPDFVWRPVAGATTYRISVSRADGDSVWATTTSDTSVSAPDALSRAGPGVYYWYVDVLLNDARSIAGSAYEFRIEP